jgi:hypothetical protein
VKPLRWFGAAALILIVSDIALLQSGYMVRVHRHETRVGELIKSKKFGEVDANGALVCTYWTGRSFRKFFDAPSGCRFLSKPTGIWVGE